MGSILEQLEDAYYGFLDKLMELGIPVDKIVGPLEDRGIPTFPLFVLLILLLVGGITFLISGLLAPPKHVFYFTDAYGNPLPNVKAVFEVDGEQLVFFSDEEGKIVIEGWDVRFVDAELEGYEFRTTEEGEGELRIILEPQRQYVRIKVRDAVGAPLEATVRIKVGGDEVFEEVGSDLEVCFAEVEAEGCIRAETDARITFSAEREGYKRVSKVYRLENLPDTVTLVLSRGEVEKEGVSRGEVETPQATLTFIVVYEDSKEPVDGLIYVAPISSDSSGTPVRVRSGISSAVTLSIGVYKVVSARVFVDNKTVDTSVVEGSPFTVEKTTKTVKIVLKRPRITYTIHFNVTDMNGNPLEGAEIRFKTEKGVVTAKTDEKGAAQITLDRKICGQYTVSAKGYEPATGKACMGDEVDVKLKKAIKKVKLTVLVYHITETPLEGATVLLYRGDSVIAEAQTDGSGKAVLKEVPVGSYRVVAEYGGQSAEENVELSSDTEVKLYIVPSEAQLTVITYLKGLPAAGVKVRVLFGKNVYSEGTTDAYGTVVLPAPEGVNLTLRLEYKVGNKQMVLEQGPFAIPPGTGSYEVEINLPTAREPFVRLEGVFAEDGTPVNVVERGKVYSFIFMVGYEGNTALKVIFDPPQIEVVDVEGAEGYQVEGGTVTVPLTSTTFTQGSLKLKIKVRYTLTEDVLYFSYALSGKGGSGYLNVGEEMDCGEVLCTRFRVTDSEGLEYETGSDLEILRTYTLTLVFVTNEEGSFRVELVMEKEQTGERDVLGAFEGKVGPSTPRKIVAQYRPLGEEGITLYAVVRAGGKVLEKKYLGSWAIYVPDFGPLFLELTAKDVKANYKYPSPTYVKNRVTAFTYRVTDASLGAPKTPVTVLFYCSTPEGEKVLYKGSSASDTATVEARCDSIRVEASALGYDTAQAFLTPLTVEEFHIAPKESTITIELPERRVIGGEPLPRSDEPAKGGSEKLAGSFQVEYSYARDLPVHPVIGASPGCGTMFVNRGNRVNVYWDGTTCRGLVKQLEIPVSVRIGPIEIGKTSFPITVIFGKLNNCVGIKGKLVTQKKRIRYDVELINDCATDIQASFSNVAVTSDTATLSIANSPSTLTLPAKRSVTASIEMNPEDIPFPVKHTLKVAFLLSLSGEAGTASAPFEVSAKLNSQDICSVDKKARTWADDKIYIKAVFSLKEEYCRFMEGGPEEPLEIRMEVGHVFNNETVWESCLGGTEERGEKRITVVGECQPKLNSCTYTAKVTLTFGNASLEAEGEGRINEEDITVEAGCPPLRFEIHGYPYLQVLLELATPDNSLYGEKISKISTTLYDLNSFVYVPTEKTTYRLFVCDKEGEPFLESTCEPPSREGPLFRDLFVELYTLENEQLLLLPPPSNFDSLSKKHKLFQEDGNIGDTFALAYYLKSCLDGANNDSQENGQKGCPHEFNNVVLVAFRPESLPPGVDIQWKKEEEAEKMWVMVSMEEGSVVREINILWEGVECELNRAYSKITFEKRDDGSLLYALNNKKEEGKTITTYTIQITGCEQKLNAELKDLNYIAAKGLYQQLLKALLGGEPCEGDAVMELAGDSYCYTKGHTGDYRSCVDGGQSANGDNISCDCPENGFKVCGTSSGGSENQGGSSGGSTEEVLP